MWTESPSANDLSRLYFELGRRGWRCVGKKRPWSFSPKVMEDLVVLAAAFCRSDPRLFGLLVEELKSRWRQQAYNDLIGLETLVRTGKGRGSRFSRAS